MASRDFDHPSTPSSFSEYEGSCDGSTSSRNSTPSASGVLTPTSIGSPDSSSVTVKTEPEAEKKPTKKRKSWGQQLPTPTTNLPPRKRAKTAEEKEQRRVERVLRNRAAAQKSRELKKAEYEVVVQERDRLAQENEKNKMIIADLERRLKALEEGKALPQLVPDGIQQPNSVKEKLLDFAPGISLDSFRDLQFTLNPSDINEGTDLDASNSETLCLTHQPAALMCDLPCQQRVSALTSISVLKPWMHSILVLWTTFWSICQDPTVISLLQDLSSIPKNDASFDNARRLESLCTNRICARLTVKTDPLKRASAKDCSEQASFPGVDSENYVERDSFDQAKSARTYCWWEGTDYGPFLSSGIRVQ